MSHGKSWPIIALFHGSRHPTPNTKARIVGKHIAALMPNRRVEVAFISTGHPCLSEALQKLASENFRRFTVVPALLFKGRHFEQDIQKEIELAKKEYPAIQVTIAQPIGACKALADILTERISDAESSTATAISIPSAAPEKDTTPP